jgi:hypothetical protein
MYKNFLFSVFTLKQNLSHWNSCLQNGCFESFPFRQKLFIFVCQTTWFWWNVRHWTSAVNVHSENSNWYKCRFNVPQLKECFAFSVKDRYRLNYLICIKDFNAQTITFKIKFVCIYCCQHHKRKTTYLDIFLLSDRQWGTEHKYLLSRFLGVSILQLLIIYRIYDYDMLTLSQ